MTYRTFIVFAATALTFPAPTFAHLLITAPTPRVANDNIKEGSAPCGGPRGSTIHELTGGQMLTIEYDETIAHPGYFQLRFSMAGDTDWMMLEDQIPDQGGVGSYTHEFQVPDVTCTDCTFQFIQVMTDRDPPTNYYNCIDVQITSSATPDPDLGTAMLDVGVVPPDMGGTPTNPGIPTADAGATPGGSNPPGGQPPGVDPAPVEADSGFEGSAVRGTGTCSTIASGGDAGMLLGLFGLLISRRRRRSFRDSSEAR